MLKMWKWIVPMSIIYFTFYKWNYTQYEQSQSDWCKKKVGHIMTIVNFI